jgi:hypothetical protein
VSRFTLAGAPAGLRVDAGFQNGAHIHAGHEQAVGVGHHGAQRHGAGAGVHAHARKLQLAGVGVAAAVFQLQGDGRFGLAAFLYASARQVAFEAQHLGAGLCDIHIQRIELRDGGERGGLVGGDQCAGRDGGGGGAARNGRLDAGVAQVDAGVVQRGAGNGQVGAGLHHGGLAIVIHLPADGVDFDQLGVAPGVDLGRAHAGLRLGHRASALASATWKPEASSW